MARWDKILSLPVQSPPKFEFSSADLEWAKVEGWSDNIEKVAFIPFDRVDNFLSGESANKDFPTRFYVEARRSPKIRVHPSKEKVDGVIEFAMYRCAFGPDDRREGGSVRPSRNTYVRKKKSAGRPSIKRGCQCYFFVKRLVAKPYAALIIYKQDKHVDEKGLPCHGPQDARAVGTRAMFAPYISDDLLRLLASLIHIGFSVETIMHIRHELIEKPGSPFNHDDFVTHRYVRRLERRIRRSKFELDEDDAVSIEMWADEHESDIFFREDYSDSEPFILGIQTEWQLQQMIKFGDNSLMAYDSRFGTNKLKHPVHSLLVFDSDKKAIPIAWIIAPRSASGDAYKWIRALHRRVRSKTSTWKLAGFIVDDPLADVLTIREVFQCSVLICFWRVRRAWHKNLVEKCLETEMRSEMFGRLGQAITSICKGNAGLDLFENFMDDFIDCSDFVEYFRAVWFPRIGMWTAALKSLPLAGQETCSAMECYHHNLKLMLLNEKDPSVYQRTDWLVDKLYSKAHSCFFLDQYPGKEDFARYMKVKYVSGLTSWQRALEIPDSDVLLEDNKCAQVISQHVREKAHVVWNPGSEFALCDCNWSGMGNLCKHVLKVSCMYRRKRSAAPSMSLFKFNQTLINMLHCPPQDSLIRDHAISLAVCVQDLLEKHGIGGSATGVSDGVTEREHLMEQMVIPTENGSGIQDVHTGVGGDLNGETAFAQVRTVNGERGESTGQVNGCSEMDVDLVSMCTSPLGLLSADGIFSSDSSVGKEDRNSLKTGLGFSETFSSNNTSFLIGGSEFREDMISKGVCLDLLDGTLAGSMMDVDPQPIQLPMFRCEIH
ncbi:hypothetical protein IFM89_009907 [Coptis chinensis]|uniref:SWIM-type domain-containing protein n=1 Tax=Coptis chinensis TaxID=261450 RepID=A0A835I135_9MAGN|nr:hypothetical protein IFM89_009907 [Coptis chinensis]